MAEVTAPDKRVWKVRRRWITQRLELPRREDFDAADGLEAIDLVDSVSGVVVGIVVALTLALALVLVWPLLALAIELIVLVLLAIAGIVGRVLFRRPWQVVAGTDGPPAEKLAWNVSGWRASGEAIAEIETALRSGREPRLGGRQGASRPSGAATP